MPSIAAETALRLGSANCFHPSEDPFEAMVERGKITLTPEIAICRGIVEILAE